MHLMHCILHQTSRKCIRIHALATSTSICNALCVTVHHCVIQQNFGISNFGIIGMGHGGALVESIAFNQRVVGSTPALAAMLGPWASPLPTVACALRHETLIQYPCCSRERL